MQRFHVGQLRESGTGQRRQPLAVLLPAGAIGFVVHIVMRSLLTAGIDPAISAQDSWWIPVNALGAVGAILVLLGMPAIAPQLVQAGSWRGVFGLALVMVGWIFFGIFLSLYGALIQPWIARESPEMLSGSMPAIV